MKNFKGTFGPLLIEINGDGELFESLCDELLTKTLSNTKIDLKITVTDTNRDFTNYKPSHSSAKEHMNFNDGSFYYDEPSPFLCKNLFNDGLCELIIKEDLKFSFKAFIKKILSPNAKINSKIEISYSLFWYVIQVLLLRKGHSFVHGGIMSEYNDAVLFMGTGGSGKTSMLFHFLSNSNYKYLAEDFGIVNTNGNTLLSSKALSIYDSDIQNGSSILKTVYNSISYREKWKWLYRKLFFHKNPMIKIPVVNFFETDKLSEKSKIKKAFYIVRSNSDTISSTKLSCEEISERLVHVTLREMKKFVELLNLINANAPIEYSYPDLENFIIDTKDVYLKAFKNVELHLLSLPFKAEPKDVEHYLHSKGLLK